MSCGVAVGHVMPHVKLRMTPPARAMLSSVRAAWQQHTHMSPLLPTHPVATHAVCIANETTVAVILTVLMIFPLFPLFPLFGLRFVKRAGAFSTEHRQLSASLAALR